MVLTLAGKIDVHIVAAYAPTATATADETYQLFTTS